MRALLLAAVLAGPAAAAPIYVRHDAGFSCAAPKGWKLRRDDVRAPKKVLASRWTGPKGGLGPAPKISVEFHPGAYVEDYLSAQKVPSQPTAIAGKTARTFTRRSSKFLPPHSLDARTVVLIEERVVLEHAKGFFALAYAAPEAQFSANRPVFQKLLDSFRPL